MGSSFIGPLVALAVVSAAPAGIAATFADVLGDVVVESGSLFPGTPDLTLTGVTADPAETIVDLIGKTRIHGVLQSGGAQGFTLSTSAPFSLSLSLSPLNGAPIQAQAIAGGFGVDVIAALAFTAPLGVVDGITPVFIEALGPGFSYILSATPVGQVGTIPLPAAGWLLLTGLAGLGFAARRRRVA